LICVFSFGLSSFVLSDLKRAFSGANGEALSHTDLKRKGNFIVSCRPLSLPPFLSNKGWDW
jgi:hypothetical protein